MRRPRIAEAFLEMNQAVMENKGRVTSALKRLIAYVSSMSTGCRYCEAHAIRAAERYGAEQEKLANIWEYKTHPAFSDAERAALDLSIAASAVPNAVDDTVAENMRKHWDEGEIVEIMGVIALFGYLNRWNDSMGTQLEKAAAAEGILIERGDINFMDPNPPLNYFRLGYSSITTEKIEPGIARLADLVRQCS